MSVERFCRVAKGLLAADQAAFVRFVLCGIYNDSQVVVDPILSRMSGDEPLSVMRDYDSILGFDKDIKVKNFLMVYPVAKREDTLTTNVHLKHTFEGNSVCLFIFLALPKAYAYLSRGFLTLRSIRFPTSASPSGGRTT